ncbi:MAG: hypothetical protein H6682_20165 [Candidatus Eisenbacteria bacterium]|nr:hypothetical protein [Candidatus Eisenbacteria bacterium]
MTTNDADKIFAAALARAARTGSEQDLRDVLNSLREELADDPVALNQVRSLLAQIQDVAEVATPRPWIDAAVARIMELERGLAPAPSLLERAKDALRDAVRIIEAQLVGDTFAGAAMQGIRGSAAFQPRQLHFSSELGDVHLQIDRSERGHSVMGQFVPLHLDLLDAEIEARATTERGTTSTHLDPGAQFHFTDVEDGEIRIELDMGKDSLRLVPFRIPSHEEG